MTIYDSATKKWEEEHVVIGISVYWCVEARKRTAILPICVVWVEILKKQPRKSLPFSEFPAIWVENSNKLAWDSLPCLRISICNNK